MSFARAVAPLALTLGLLGPAGLEAETIVHLLQHAADAADAKLVSVPLGDDATPRPGTIVLVAAIGHPNHRGIYIAPAAGDGPRVAWAARAGGPQPPTGETAPGETATVLHWRTGPGARPRSIPLPAAPAALHLNGEALYVGLPGAVGYVDLGAAKPVFEEVHRRGPVEGKAYDIFLRSGDRLVAVDDRRRPYFADLFVLGDRGRPQHRAPWELPGIVNGSYGFGALVRTDAQDEGTVVLTASFSVITGRGNDLVALSIRGDALPVDGSVTLNSRSHDPLVVLDEFRPRGRSRPARALAGAKATPWRGFAMAPGSILLAVGERGVLVVPYPFVRDTKGALVKTGGFCHDVAVAGPHVLALVETEGKGELLRLTRGAKGWDVNGRHALPDVFQRFVK